MLYLWRTQNAILKLKLVISQSTFLFAEDIRENSIKAIRYVVKKFGLYSVYKNYKLESEVTSIKNIEHRKNSLTHCYNHIKPVIFVSACVSEKTPGGWKYNGGIKELNYLVKLLRKHGYEAYMVTYDGKYEPWLIEHQPHISMEEFRSKLRSSPNVRCVTSYAVARAFTNECKQLYFWDMELALTNNSNFHVLCNLYNRHQIKNVATISRTIEAWHLANFQQQCTVIPNLIDEDIWFPLEEKRDVFQVGYMDEGTHVQKYINLIKNAASEKNIPLNFQIIKGNEEDVLNQMRSCNVYLGMNVGKDPLWGEGCPRTNLEALSAGCVVIAFDVIGNREIIHNGFNGILVPRFRPDLMVEALINLYKEPSKLELLRENSLKLLESCHIFDARWPAVKEFLDLNIDVNASSHLTDIQHVETYCRELQKWSYGEYLMK